VRLVTFSDGGGSSRAKRVGLLDGADVIDLADGALPADMLRLLEAGPSALDAARSAATRAPRHTLEQVSLEAPIARPPKVLAVGLNYADHVAETGRDTPTIPILFNKQSTAANGPFGEIVRPRVSPALDYEGEFGVVIGKRCRHVPREHAHEVIAGYTVVNDVSVRDWQVRSPTMTMGKSFDTHCPFGPAIVTPDELPDPHDCDLRTYVNGELRQQSNTRELIFDCFDLIEHVSTAFTLEPGDLISTGTCGGVAAAMKPPKWLVPGDVVRVEIEGLGAIENTVVDEAEDA